MRPFSSRSHLPIRSSSSGPAKRGALIGALALAAALAACSGAGGPAPAVSAAAVATGAPSSAPGGATPSTGGSSSTAGNPADSCLVATKADVEAAFGGSSTVGRTGSYGMCTFDVSGKLKAGNPGDSPLGLRVFFDPKYIPYATIKQAMGDAVAKVDGVGSEAYYASTQGLLHVQVPGGMLTVGATNLDLLDKGVLQQSVAALARAILARL